MFEVPCGSTYIPIVHIPLESSAKKPTELAGIFQFELKTCTMYIRVTICPKGFQIGTKCNACNATVRPVVVV